MSTKMSAPVFLMFKIEPEKYQVFQMVAWKARSEHVVTVQDGKLVCSCQMFRFEGKCQHLKAIDALPTFVYGSANWCKLEKPIDWHLADPFKYVVVGDERQAEVVGVISYELGDLNCFDLLRVLTEPTVPDYIKEGPMANEHSFLNPTRIYVEVRTSMKHQVAVTDSKVTDAGLAIKPLTRDDVPIIEDFDESFDDAAPAAKTAPTPAATAKSKAGPAWKTIKRPNPSAFYVRADDWEQLLYTVEYGGNVLITGPSGSGKSELAYFVAKAMGRPIEAFNFGAMSEPRTSLIGNTHFDKTKGTWFAESRFVRAIKTPETVLLLDELTRDRGAGAHNILLTLLDRQGYLSLDEHEMSPRIEKASGVSFIATANVGAEYTGTEALDAALRNRMDVMIDMDFPPKEYEIKILMSRCPGLRAGEASRLVELAVSQREMVDHDGEFSEGGKISTRMLLAAGKRIGDGMSFENAVKYSIANHYSQEGGDASERAMILQMIQKNAS